MTHLHDDHFAEEAVAAASTPTTRIIGPAALRARVPRAMVMGNGARRAIGDVVVEAVPMHNGQRGPKPGDVFHRKGEATATW